MTTHLVKNVKLAAIHPRGGRYCDISTSNTIFRLRFISWELFAQCQYIESTICYSQNSIYWHKVYFFYKKIKYIITYLKENNIFSISLKCIFIKNETIIINNNNLASICKTGNAHFSRWQKLQSQKSGIFLKNIMILRAMMMKKALGLRHLLQRKEGQQLNRWYALLVAIKCQISSQTHLTCGTI